MRVALLFAGLALAGAPRGGSRRRQAQPRPHPLAAEASSRRRLQDARAGDVSAEYSSYASQLREDLFDGYDMWVPPSGGPEREAVYASEAGSDVGIQIRFFKVDQVSAAEGAMKLKVWFRLTWYDPRLSWNSTEYGGIETIYAGTVADLAEIWVPDVTPYNVRVGLEASFDATAASISSGGYVFWSRPGIMDVMCKFSGLVQFPFDQLTCPIEVGAWSYNGNHLGLTLTNGGYTFDSQEATAGSSYQEFSLESVNCSLDVFVYPSGAFPVAMYEVHLKRASFFYLNVAILPPIALTITSFGVFFMSYEVGERLGFGITLILAMEVTKVVIADFLPVCGEMMWIEVLLGINTWFTYLALLETCFVLFLAYHTDSHIVPKLVLPPQRVLLFMAWLFDLPGPTPVLARQYESAAAECFQRYNIKAKHAEQAAEAVEAAEAEEKSVARKRRQSFLSRHMSVGSFTYNGTTIHGHAHGQPSSHPPSPPASPPAGGDGEQQRVGVFGASRLTEPGTASSPSRLGWLGDMVSSSTTSAAPEEGAGAGLSSTASSLRNIFSSFTSSTSSPGSGAGSAGSVKVGCGNESASSTSDPPLSPPGVVWQRSSDGLLRRADPVPPSATIATSDNVPGVGPARAPFAGADTTSGEPTAADLSNEQMAMFPFMQPRVRELEAAPPAAAPSSKEAALARARATPAGALAPPRRFSTSDPSIVEAGMPSSYASSDWKMGGGSACGSGLSAEEEAAAATVQEARKSHSHAVRTSPSYARTGARSGGGAAARGLHEGTDGSLRPIDGMCMSTVDGEVMRGDLLPVGTDPGTSLRVASGAAGNSPFIKPTTGGDGGGAGKSAHTSAANARLQKASVAFAEAPTRPLVFTFDPTDGWMRPNRLLSNDDMFRLSFFEKMFFMIDSDSNGYLTYLQLDRLFSFVAYRYSPTEREEALGMGACYSHEVELQVPKRGGKSGVSQKTMQRGDGQALDFSTGVDSNGDGVMDCQEFVRACTAHLWDVPLAMLELACRNFLEASVTKAERNQFYWKTAAKQVDKAARFWVVSAYFVALGWVFSTSFHDDYSNPTTDHMFEGMGPRVTSLVWVVGPAMVFVMVLMVLFGWLRTWQSRARKRSGSVSSSSRENSGVSDVPPATAELRT